MKPFEVGDYVYYLGLREVDRIKTQHDADECNNCDYKFLNGKPVISYATPKQIKQYREGRKVR